MSDSSAMNALSRLLGLHFGLLAANCVHEAARASRASTPNEQQICSMTHRTLTQSRKGRLQR